MNIKTTKNKFERIRKSIIKSIDELNTLSESTDENELGDIIREIAEELTMNIDTGESSCVNYRTFLDKFEEIEELENEYNDND